MEKAKAMYSLVEEYRNSGVSVRKFAGSKGIKVSTFTYWVRRKKLLEGKTGYGNFVAVDTKSWLTPPAEFQIVYPNGVRIVISKLDVAQIQQLVKLY
jgi:hypothetical protein